MDKYKKINQKEIYHPSQKYKFIINSFEYSPEFKSEMDKYIQEKDKYFWEKDKYFRERDKYYNQSIPDKTIIQKLSDNNYQTIQEFELDYLKNNYTHNFFEKNSENWLHLGDRLPILINLDTGLKIDYKKLNAEYFYLSPDYNTIVISKARWGQGIKTFDFFDFNGEDPKKLEYTQDIRPYLTCGYTSFDMVPKFISHNTGWSIILSSYTEYKIENNKKIYQDENIFLDISPDNHSENNPKNGDYYLELEFEIKLIRTNNKIILVNIFKSEYRIKYEKILSELDYNFDY